MDADEALVVGFVARVRTAGVEVPVSSTVELARALEAVGAATRQAVYWAGRATLVRRPEDIAPYDSAFAAFWETAPMTGLVGGPPETVVIALDDPDAVDEPPGEQVTTQPVPAITVRYSATERLRHKDFAAYSAAESEEARRLMAHMRLAGPARRSRRMRPARGRAGRVDLRRTVRAALRTEGEVVNRRVLEHSERRRRIVLLCDISGSMEPYSRSLLRFLHAAVAAQTRIEAFALGTRLTRLTRELSTRDADRALDAASHAVADWSGGTRLGDGLRAFNDAWGVRGMARGAVVVILSDGWDRGEPAHLAEEMARLRRVAHRVVWVNPLKATPGYAPLARGMAAALPYIDSFVEGHSLAALETLAEVISQ